MKTGIVKFYDKSKGFGFIKIEDTGEEVFVRATGLIDQIKDQDKVSFEIQEAKKGPMAVQVKILS